MDSPQVTARLAQFQDGVLIAHAEDVLDALDSLDLVELSQFIENRFLIKVGIEDVTVANFGALNSIVNMVCTKLRGVRNDG